VLAGLLLMRKSEMFPVERPETAPTLLGGTREALAYVARARRPLVVLVLVCVVSTFAFNFNVLLPVLAKQTLGGGPETFGVLSACFGAGALAGALLSASLGRASWRALLLGTAGFGLAELLLAPERSVAAAGALLVVTGLCFTLWTSNANSSLQLAAPDALRGRVIGLYYFAFNGTGPVGGILSGWLAAVGGTALAFGVGGTIALLAVGGTLVARGSLRRRRLEILTTS
jgi:MFS family permease